MCVLTKGPKECGQDSHDVMKDDYKLIVDFSEIEADRDTEEDQPNHEDHVPRRSTRQSRQPDYYGREHSSLCEAPNQPASYQEATNGPDRKRWQAADMLSMKSGTW